MISSLCSNEFHSKRYNFDLSKELGRNWNQDDQFLTILTNALSMPIPSGEVLFIKAIKNYQDKVKDQQLLKTVKEFIRQEAAHTKEHVSYNKILCESRGYDYSILESTYRSHNEYIIKKYEAIHLLGITVCMEHLTAVLSYIFLSDESFVGGVTSNVSRLWYWHSIEELEHKSVAFDVYFCVGGTKSMLNRVMTSTVKQLAENITFTACQMYMMEGGRPSDFRGWLKQAAILNSETGLFPLMLSQINEFFNDDFHPSNRNDRELIVSAINLLNETF